MSGKPNLNFPILSFETCFNLFYLMHNRPSNQILPHSDTPFCLCKPKEIMNAHQTRHENPAKKNYFYTALGVRNSAFTLLVVVFQQL